MTKPATYEVSMTGAEFMRAVGDDVDKWTDAAMEGAARHGMTVVDRDWLHDLLDDAMDAARRLSRPVVPATEDDRAMTAPRALYADPPTDPNVAEVAAPKGGPASDGYTRNLDDTHSRLVRWFEESENTGTDARDRSNRDRDYVTGIQWTRAELKPWPTAISRPSPSTTAPARSN